MNTCLRVTKPSFSDENLHMSSLISSDSDIWLQIHQVYNNFTTYKNISLLIICGVVKLVRVWSALYGIVNHLLCIEHATMGWPCRLLGHNDVHKPIVSYLILE